MRRGGWRTCVAAGDSSAKRRNPAPASRQGDCESSRAGEERAVSSWWNARLTFAHPSGARRGFGEVAGASGPRTLRNLHVWSEAAQHRRPRRLARYPRARILSTNARLFRLSPAAHRRIGNSGARSPSSRIGPADGRSSYAVAWQRGPAGGGAGLCEARARFCLAGALQQLCPARSVHHVGSTMARREFVGARGRPGLSREPGALDDHGPRERRRYSPLGRPLPRRVVESRDRGFRERVGLKIRNEPAFAVGASVRGP